MLQFTDDRQIRPGTLVGVPPDVTKVRPLKEARRLAIAACETKIRQILDFDKQVYYGEDTWMTRFTPENQAGGPKSLWWTGVSVFECYEEEKQTPREATPEPASPDRGRGLQKVGIWERADFGVWEFQYP